MKLTRRAFTAAALSMPGMRAAARRPNIVVIVADDLGFADLGFQGSRDIRTPHLDRLAASGVRFDNGYVTHPFCSPTRAGLLTGRYQQRFGHENNMVFDQRDEVAGLPLTEKTLPELLQQAGYATGIVGKWHLGAHPRFHPMKRGFREMFGFVGGGHDYFDPGHVGADDQHFIPNERDGRPVVEKEYLTTALGREAEAYIRRHAKDPFFLYFAFNAPHAPLQAPPEYEAKYAAIQDPKRRTYAAMVTAMDDAIGRALDTLKELKLEENTLVFFLSDNGGPTGNASSNAPLRGTKRSLYEGGVRVPFVMRWPGRVGKPRVESRPVVSLDVFATALAAAGVKTPADRVVDGVDLVPYLSGKQAGDPHPRLYWRTFGGVEAAIREGQWKWVRSVNAAPELFDLAKDPGEKNNLIAQRPAEAARLQSAWEEWNRQMRPPLWPDHIFDRKPK
jgi:arylsulfatase A-like enzyme